MRENLKKLFPEFQKLLKSDFIDGDIYFENYTGSKIVTLNYTQFTDENIKTLIRALTINKRLLDEEKQICKEVIKIVAALNVEINDVYIIIEDNVEKRCLLHLCKKPEINATPLSVFLTINNQDYGIIWRNIGRPVWKRMGWKIL